jgi:hypothetical protein
MAEEFMFIVGVKHVWSAAYMQDMKGAKEKGGKKGIFPAFHTSKSFARKTVS